MTVSREAMERLVATTSLLAFASAVAGLGWSAWTSPPVAARGRDRGDDRVGKLGFAVVLGIMGTIMTLTMRGSADPVERAAPWAVFGLVAAVTGLLGLARWAGAHRHPAVRLWLDHALHRAAARGAAASFTLALGGTLVMLTSTPAALGGFLAAAAPLLWFGGASTISEYGWKPAWWRRRFPVLTGPGAARPAAPAARAWWTDFLELAPAARSALQKGYLVALMTGFAVLFLAFLPLGLLLRLAGPHPVAGWLPSFIFGVMGGGVFVMLLPFAMLAGFAFGFILMPLGLLRPGLFGGGAAGGAGAGGEI